MVDLFTATSTFSVLLTIGLFQVGLWLQNKTKISIALISSILMVIAVLTFLGIPNQVYQDSMKVISWLITPATICLAVPMYQQVQKLKRELPVIFVSVSAGVVANLVVVLVLCRVLRMDEVFSISILPKSITTAIGLALCEQNHGIVGLTSASIAVTGNIGSLLGVSFLRLFHLESPTAQGVALGTSSHLIGTSRANQLGSYQAAVSSLSVAIAGILTAVIFPIVLRFV